MIYSLYSILLGVDLLIAIGVITLVMLQHGKGADAGAAFGSGASSTIFGAQGSTSFLSRMTAVLAALFFINSLGLAYLAAHRPTSSSVIDKLDTQIEQPQTQTPGVNNDAVNENDIDTNDSEATDTPVQESPDSAVPSGDAADIPIEENAAGDNLNQTEQQEGETLPQNAPVDDVPDKF